MKSIQSRFKKVQKENPSWGDYPVLAKAVTNQKFKRETIGIWFRKLVAKNEYELKDSNKLISQLYKLSNPPEDTGFEAKNSIREPKPERVISFITTNNFVA